MIRSLAQARATEDVKGAYRMSAERAEEITNSAGSLLWSTNMKYPSIYAQNESVRAHYERIVPLIAKRANIDARRVHLFYKAMAHPDYAYRSEVEFLLGTLIGEYLVGIDNRVLWLTHSEDIFCGDAESGKRVGCLHLLDYALGYSPGARSAVPGTGGSMFHILCADFTADRQEEVAVTRTLPQIQEKMDLELERYRREKVYDIQEPALFPLFQEHFLAMWDVSKYAERVTKQYADDPYISKLAQQLTKEADSFDVFGVMAKFGELGRDCSCDQYFKAAFSRVYRFEDADESGGLNEKDLMKKLEDVLRMGMRTRGNSGRIAKVKGVLDELRVRRFSGETVM